MNKIFRRFVFDFSINRNMRCIEMSCGFTGSDGRGMINRNMRCIEMNANFESEKSDAD